MCGWHRQPQRIQLLVDKPTYKLQAKREPVRLCNSCRVPNNNKVKGRLCHSWLIWWTWLFRLDNRRRPADEGAFRQGIKHKFLMAQDWQILVVLLLIRVLLDHKLTLKRDECHVRLRLTQMLMEIRARD